MGTEVNSFDTSQPAVHHSCGYLVAKMLHLHTHGTASMPDWATSLQTHTLRWMSLQDVKNHLQAH